MLAKKVLTNTMVSYKNIKHHHVFQNLGNVSSLSRTSKLRMLLAKLFPIRTFVFVVFFDMFASGNLIIDVTGVVCLYYIDKQRPI